METEEDREAGYSDVATTVRTSDAKHSASAKTILEAVYGDGTEETRVSVVCGKRDEDGTCLCTYRETVSPSPDRKKPSRICHRVAMALSVAFESDKEWLVWTDVEAQFRAMGAIPYGKERAYSCWCSSG